jgi:hypothetical protein
MWLFVRLKKMREKRLSVCRFFFPPNKKFKTFSMQARKNNNNNNNNNNNE